LQAIVILLQYNIKYTSERAAIQCYAIQFHLVMRKTRKRILTGLLDDRLKGIVDEMSAIFGIQRN